MQGLLFKYQGLQYENETKRSFNYGIWDCLIASSSKILSSRVITLEIHSATKNRIKDLFLSFYKMPTTNINMSTVVNWQPRKISKIRQGIYQLNNEIQFLLLALTYRQVNNYENMLTSTSLCFLKQTVGHIMQFIILRIMSD